MRAPQHARSALAGWAEYPGAPHCALAGAGAGLVPVLPCRSGVVRDAEVRSRGPAALVCISSPPRPCSSLGLRSPHLPSFFSIWE